MQLLNLPHFYQTGEVATQTTPPKRKEQPKGSEVKKKFFSLYSFSSQSAAAEADEIRVDSSGGSCCSPLTKEKKKASWLCDSVAAIKWLKVVCLDSILSDFEEIAGSNRQSWRKGGVGGVGGGKSGINLKLVSD